LIASIVVVLVYALCCCLATAGDSPYCRGAQSVSQRSKHSSKRFYDFFKLMGKESLTPNVTKPTALQPRADPQRGLYCSLRHWLLPLAASASAVGAGDLILVIYLLAIRQLH